MSGLRELGSWNFLGTICTGGSPHACKLLTMPAIFARPLLCKCEQNRIVEGTIVDRWVPGDRVRLLTRSQEIAAEFSVDVVRGSHRMLACSDHTGRLHQVTYAMARLEPPGGDSWML